MHNKVKCLNAGELVKVVEKDKDGPSPPLLFFAMTVPLKKTQTEKII